MSTSLIRLLKGILNLETTGIKLAFTGRTKEICQMAAGEILNVHVVWVQEASVLQG